MTQAVESGERARRAAAPAGPALSVIICTYNRAQRLLELLESLAAQRVPGGDAAFEIVVVDNNSTDHTAAAVTDFATAARPGIRYVREQRQGKSFALNTGLQAARGPICLVLDDDQRMPAGYLAKLLALFDEHPGVSFIGGRVLPLWEAPPPAWLTPEWWSPLGMADYGPESFIVAASRLVCLLTFAFRKADVEAVGGFRSELGLSAGWPGSTEDAELIRRLVASGRRGLYAPELVLEHHAPAARATAAYYRKWYRGHGAYLALDRDPAIERARFQLLGVPSHMLRAAGADATGALAQWLRGDRAAAFRHELQLHQFAGFVRQRLRRAGRTEARTRNS